YSCELRNSIMYDGTVGEIRLFAGNFPPRDWAFCNGQVLPIASNQALFSILGTTYGGDGKSTFALPDLRGAVPVGTGSSPNLTVQLGETLPNTQTSGQGGDDPTNTPGPSGLGLNYCICLFGYSPARD